MLNFDEMENTKYPRTYGKMLSSIKTFCVRLSFH